MCPHSIGPVGAVSVYGSEGGELNNFTFATAPRLTVMSLVASVWPQTVGVSLYVPGLTNFKAEAAVAGSS